MPTSRWSTRSSPPTPPAGEAVQRADELRGRAEDRLAGGALARAPRSGPPSWSGPRRWPREVKEAEEAERAADAALRAAHLPIPNVVADEVPPGGEDDAVTLRTVGEVPAYDFPVRDHLEIGEALGAIDMERGAKVSGARFYFLTGPGALLEFALAQLAISRAVAAGFTPVVAPALVRPEAMEGTGFLGEHDEEVYRIERDDLYLVGTSEVALAGMHVERGARPLRRPAALRRLVVLLPPRGRLLRQGHPRHHPRALVRQGRDVQLLPARGDRGRAPAAAAVGGGVPPALELPYRVVDIAAGDLGTSATRKYDIEAWFPSQGTYRELTSTSDCTTFQARRLNIRYRDEDGKPQTAATLNGTLCAIARTIACLLEVHQQADGSVHVPVALRPWLGGIEAITPGHDARRAGAAGVTASSCTSALAAVRSAARGRRGGRARRPGAWRPKLVATDLDGTLLNAAGRGQRPHPGRAGRLLGRRHPGRRRHRPRAAAARQRAGGPRRPRDRGARAGRVRRRPGARRGAAHRRAAPRPGDAGDRGHRGGGRRR